MTSVVTQVAARLLLVPILMVALAILVKGFADVGDGFSAGVIAALGLLLQYVAFGRAEVERALPIRHLPALSFGALAGAIALAFAPLLAGRPILTHSPPAGEEVVKLGTLELTTAVAFDVLVFVLVLGVVTGIIHTIGRALEEVGEE